MTDSTDNLFNSQTKSLIQSGKVRIWTWVSKWNRKDVFFKWFIPPALNTHLWIKNTEQGSPETLFVYIFPQASSGRKWMYKKRVSGIREVFKKNIQKVGIFQLQRGGGPKLQNSNFFKDLFKIHFKLFWVILDTLFLRLFRGGRSFFIEGFPYKCELIF